MNCNSRERSDRIFCERFPLSFSLPFSICVMYRHDDATRISVNGEEMRKKGAFDGERGGGGDGRMEKEEGKRR